MWPLCIFKGFLGGLSPGDLSKGQVTQLSDIVTSIWWLLRGDILTDFLVCPDVTLSAHDVVLFLSCFVCLLEDPLGAIQTPNILEAWDAGSLSIFWGYYGVFRNRFAWLSSRLHWLVESCSNSSRYHFVLIALTCPPVGCAASERVRGLTGLV